MCSLRHLFPSPRISGLFFATILAVACTGNRDRQTLAQLRKVEPDLAEVEINHGIDQAMEGYRKFLEEAPKSSLTPEAMRRLADLKLEKEYGILDEVSQTAESRASLPAPDRTERAPEIESRSPAALDVDRESDRDFEERVASEVVDPFSREPLDLELPVDMATDSAGPLEAIKLYDEILAAYPDYPHNDQVLYQKARAYEELGKIDEAVEVATLLVSQYPESRHLDELQFRRGEYFFTRKKMLDAEEAYASIVAHGPGTGYYELALYKLGWTLYKQMLLDEAVVHYITLLDYKTSIGYDFDQTEDETDSQRIADTYRVISLCFSDLGGADAIASFFSANGPREYEHRVYRNLGEFYLEKLRYNDAAMVYEAFVDLYPIHQASPHFSMRVVEIYEAGNFPKLVLESKKAFTVDYGLESRYWQHFQAEDAPEVLEYLKSNLKDLANHYHALYQNPEIPDEQTAHFVESSRWYREYLSSFPDDSETPGINYQFADLLLENDDFDLAAQEYEHTAYDYPQHERSAAAGYAAIFARREHLKQAVDTDQELVRRNVVASTLRFVDGFPEHEHAPAVLGAAVDDLYALEEFETAITTAQRLIGQYPDSETSIRRAAWTVIAHSSFDIESFEAAEQAYARVLEMTAADDDTAPDITNNLAAAIYKQGEQAKVAEDYRTAADHFLRISEAAPLSDIGPIAQYDAGAALIQLKDFSGAVEVFESFRTSNPDHELRREATRQLAFVYREEENFSQAAEEYERVAEEADDPELRREALLVAGDLYEKAEMLDRALSAYQVFVTEFTDPIEPVVVTRFKMAELYEQMGNVENHHAQLRKIVRMDREAGDARTDGVRVLAAKSALILSEVHFRGFEDIALVQPFEKSLQKKKRQMDTALTAFSGLIDYEVGEVTAAATFYMAEVYGEFSRALLESERPSDLGPADRQEYEEVLEEEAYPFEEQAIEVHLKNLELMSAGVFNVWIEKSLSRLAVVMPGRYAKFEESSGLIESVESYSYRTPISLVPVQVADTTDETDGEGTREIGVEDTMEPTEATEFIDAVMVAESSESEEPVVIEESSESEEPVVIAESSESEEPVVIEESSELEDPVVIAESSELEDTVVMEESSESEDTVSATESSESNDAVEEVEPDMLEHDAAEPVPAAPMPTGTSQVEVSEELEIGISAQSEEASNVELD
jgi:tetratricopeptide (TPR) repeat protein